MLTLNTIKAIQIMHFIAGSSNNTQMEKVNNTELVIPEDSILLGKLSEAGLIEFSGKGDPLSLLSYNITDKYAGITLYNILRAIGESLILIDPEEEEERIYNRSCGRIGILKLGVVNQTLRALLNEIHLADL